jgi:hypothetical protein
VLAESAGDDPPARTRPPLLTHIDSWAPWDAPHARGSHPADARPPIPPTPSLTQQIPAAGSQGMRELGLLLLHQFLLRGGPSCNCGPPPGALRVQLDPISATWRGNPAVAVWGGSHLIIYPGLRSASSDDDLSGDFVPIASEHPQAFAALSLLAAMHASSMRLISPALVAARCGARRPAGPPAVRRCTALPVLASFDFTSAGDNRVPGQRRNKNWMNRQGGRRRSEWPPPPACMRRLHACAAFSSS